MKTIFYRSYIKVYENMYLNRLWQSSHAALWSHRPRGESLSLLLLSTFDVSFKRKTSKSHKNTNITQTHLSSVRYSSGWLARDVYSMLRRSINLLSRWIHTYFRASVRMSMRAKKNSAVYMIFSINIYLFPSSFRPSNRWVLSSSSTSSSVSLWKVIAATTTMRRGALRIE